MPHKTPLTVAQQSDADLRIDQRVAVFPTALPQELYGPRIDPLDLDNSVVLSLKTPDADSPWISAQGFEWVSLAILHNDATHTWGGATAELRWKPDNVFNHKDGYPFTPSPIEFDTDTRARAQIDVRGIMFIKLITITSDSGADPAAQITWMGQ